ncbi:hypothetical protein SDC9_194275 [bioreactor metagenome]|jgi:hypothetical protein|uniref:Uncharacterized protein n=1 Tax=bioreactor metagenome TaxID=1076179 RepID=A0A645I603_9ZZZZ
MESFKEILAGVFAVDSVWSIVFRGALWLLISLVIIATVDSQGENLSNNKLKSTLGFFLMFLFLSGALIYLLFGVAVG